MNPSRSAISRLRTSGTEELSELFEANRNNLRTLISKRIQGALAARFDASDIIQETFIRANKQLRTYLQSPQIHPVVWIRILCKTCWQRVFASTCETGVHRRTRFTMLATNWWLKGWQTRSTR